MTLTYSGTIERTIDRTQDGLTNNRLRVFVDAETHAALTIDRRTGAPGLSVPNELAIRRRDLKMTCVPLAQGRRARVTRFRGSFDLLDRPGFSVEFSFLFWLECRGAVAFARAKALDRAVYNALRKDDSGQGVRGDFGFSTLGRLCWVPDGVEAADVRGWELAVMAGGAEALAGYEAWLSAKCPAWVRLADVRGELGRVVAQRTDGR